MRHGMSWNPDHPDTFDAEAFERVLERHLTPDACAEDRIWQASRYSALCGGKRIRPRLLFMTCRLFSKDIPDEAMDFAAAIEMIHTYSLIHDDLPSMDNDDYRRGQLSCHRKFDEATAVLAGDLLLNRAFETAVSACVKSGRPEALRALHFVARMSGGEGMVLGQSLDLAMTARESASANACREPGNGVCGSSASTPDRTEMPPEDGRNNTGSAAMHHPSLVQVETMASLKTGCLLRAASCAGACLAGGSDEDLTRVDRYASEIGRMFQIRDDILDTESTREQLGKTPLKDARDGKKTFVTILGSEKAQEALQCSADWAADALLELQNSGRETDVLMAFTHQLLIRNA